MVDKNPSAFDFSKLFVLSYLSVGDSVPLACASKACYRTSRMPHLWSHAASYGVVTVGVNQDEAARRCQLLFGFIDDVPHEKGLSLFCGLEQAADLDRIIGSRWLPVFNFHVPDEWVNLSVQEVLEDEEFAICGICRRDRSTTREMWFPGLEEQFQEHDEVVLTLSSAKSFAKKYLAGYFRDLGLKIETCDARKLQMPYLSFKWSWSQGGEDPDGDELEDIDLELDAHTNRHALVRI